MRVVSEDVKRLPAIKTEYKGIEFRSKSEAKYAKAFDKLGIKWLYEEQGYEFEDGTRYCPDFYLPEIDTWFEVKGLMFNEDKHKVDNLIENANCVTAGDTSGSIEASELRAGYDCLEDYWIVRCRKCGKIWFQSQVGWWNCNACGAYDGDAYMSVVEDDGNIFNLVDETTGW